MAKLALATLLLGSHLNLLNDSIYSSASVWVIKHSNKTALSINPFFQKKLGSQIICDSPLGMMLLLREFWTTSGAI